MTSDCSKISGDNIPLIQQLKQVHDHEAALRNLIDDHEETIKELKAKPNINDDNPMMTCYENSIPYLSNDIQ